MYVEITMPESTKLPRKKMRVPLTVATTNLDYPLYFGGRSESCSPIDPFPVGVVRYINAAE